MLQNKKGNVLRQFLTETNISDSLCEHWGYLKQQNIELLDCHLVRIYPKTIEKFILLYEINLKSAEKKVKKQLLAEWYGNNAHDQFKSLIIQLQKSKRAQLNKERHATDPVGWLPDLGLVVRLLGLDEKIDGLGLFQQPKLLAEILENQLGLVASTILNPKVELLGHRLGKRCIGKVTYQYIQPGTTEEKSLFLKFYKTDSQAGIHAHQFTKILYQNNFSRQDPIRIPEPLGFNQQFNLLFMEHAAGKFLTEIPVSDHTSALFSAGQAINKLHKTKSVVAKTFSINNEIEILNHWVPLTASIFPELSVSLYTTFDTLKKQFETITPVEFTLVHRDFYEKQILFTDNSTTLIDFDTACIADPAIDLGNFIAHLQLLTLQGFALPIEAENHFINGYGAEYTSALHHRVMLYKQSTLLRLVCLYSFWPQYKQLPKQLLKLFFES